MTALPAFRRFIRYSRWSGRSWAIFALSGVYSMMAANFIRFQCSRSNVLQVGQHIATENTSILTTVGAPPIPSRQNHPAERDRIHWVQVIPSRIKPEIKSPAGHWPQLHAAIEAGADAVLRTDALH